jgi:hypothetical protein
MTKFKKQGIFVFAILFSALVLFSGCVPREKKSKFPFHRQSNELIQTITEKLKDGTLKDALPPELEKVLIERIKTGTLKDFLPPTSIIIFGMMIPIISILAFLAFLIVFLRLYHIRAMSRIEKGDYERKPLNIRWNLFFLFSGLVLTFLGPAISIYMISLFELQSWTVTSGIIPLFIGISLLVFYKMYDKIK